MVITPPGDMLLHGLPPHGGSGLKSNQKQPFLNVTTSPSTRREWIEIQKLVVVGAVRTVSLHTEGVD